MVFTFILNAEFDKMEKRGRFKFGMYIFTYSIKKEKERCNSFVGRGLIDTEWALIWQTIENLAITRVFSATQSTSFLFDVTEAYVGVADGPPENPTEPNLTEPNIF